MDSRDYALQLAATEAEYKQVKAEAERVIRLYEKQSVSENDYDKAVSGLQQITAKYNAHRNALADTRLTAPFDGYVQKIHYDAGETVAAGMPVVSLISSSAPEVEINIPASEFIRSDEFETYRCSSEIYPDREFPLELVSISRKANLNQLYTARLRFLPTGPDTPLTPGMSVMVTIGLRSGTTGAVKIPLSAMLEHDGTPAVWVYNPADSTVALRKIRPSDHIAGRHTDSNRGTARRGTGGECRSTRPKRERQGQAVAGRNLNERGRSAMKDLGNWALDNRKLIYFLVAVLTIGGVFAYYDMSKLEDPEIKVKQAAVVTVYPGASAHQVELEVTDVLEKSIRSMKDIGEVTSRSMNDMS